MRVWLAKDPKVVAIADYLACQRPFMDWLTHPTRQSCSETAYEHVTRNVTVSVTVTALLQIWGVANESGKPDGDDLVLLHATLESLDEVCGVPCIGTALLHVEWASEEEPIRGKTLVRFPKFLTHNVPAEDRHRKANAERQRKLRDKRRNAESNVTGNATDNVTVTHREEKRRITTHIPPSGAFLRFWGAWPKSSRKQAQGKCWSIWRKADLDQCAEAIVSHVDALKVSADWSKQGGAFIPAPIVYLNQRRWEGAEAPTAAQDAPMYRREGVM